MRNVTLVGRAGLTATAAFMLLGLGAGPSTAHPLVGEDVGREPDDRDARACGGDDSMAYGSAIRVAATSDPASHLEAVR